jgi:hypothetical protein
MLHELQLALLVFQPFSVRLLCWPEKKKLSEPVVVSWLVVLFWVQAKIILALVNEHKRCFFIAR